jgi:hypothetical protein
VPVVTWLIGGCHSITLQVSQPFYASADTVEHCDASNLNTEILCHMVGVGSWYEALDPDLA